MAMLNLMIFWWGNSIELIRERRKQLPPLLSGIGGFLSHVRDKFPNQIPLSKEQELLKDRLFHGCQKSIQDSIKYCHADPSVDYMTFLKECRKAEDEDRAGKSKSKGNLKVATATISSTQSDALAKQLKRQQQQFDTLMGKMQSMIVTLQSQTVQASSTFRQGNASFGMRGRWEDYI